MNNKIAALIALVAYTSFTSAIPQLPINQGAVPSATYAVAASASTSGSVLPTPTNGGGGTGVMPPKTKFALLSYKTNKFCSESGKGLVCDRDKLGPWETMTVVNAWDSNLVFINGYRGGMCYSTEQGISCNGNAKDETKPFFVTWYGDDKFSLKGQNGKFCSVKAEKGGQVVCDADQTTDNEIFLIHGA